MLAPLTFTRVNKVEPSVASKLKHDTSYIASILIRAKNLRASVGMILCYLSFILPSSSYYQHN